MLAPKRLGRFQTGNSGNVMQMRRGWHVLEAYERNRFVGRFALALHDRSRAESDCFGCVASLCDPAAQLQEHRRRMLVGRHRLAEGKITQVLQEVVQFDKTPRSPAARRASRRANSTGANVLKPSK